MSTGEDDAAYLASRRRVQRWKKSAVGLAGLSAILGGVFYATTTLLAARDATTAGDPSALAPIVTSAPPSSPSAEATADSATTEAKTPSPSSRPPRLSGVRRSSRPSPTPSPSVIPDDEFAAAQVSRLLQAPHSGGGLTAAGEAITVANQQGPDGSLIRVVSARYDLTSQWKLLWVADTGLPVGTARCTRHFRTDGGSIAETRHGMLLCWRTTTDRSVVTVATREDGSPSPAAGVAALERAWLNLE